MNSILSVDQKDSVNERFRSIHFFLPSFLVLQPICNVNQNDDYNRKCLMLNSKVLFNESENKKKKQRQKHKQQQNIHIHHFFTFDFKLNTDKK